MMCGIEWSKLHVWCTRESWLYNKTRAPGRLYFGLSRYSVFLRNAQNSFTVRHRFLNLSRYLFLNRSTFDVSISTFQRTFQYASPKIKPLHNRSPPTLPRRTTSATANTLDVRLNKFLSWQQAGCQCVMLILLLLPLKGEISHQARPPSSPTV